MATKNGNGVKSNGAEMSCYNCGYQCGGSCCGHGNVGHYLVRWILGVVVIIFVLLLGIQIGELKGAYTADNQRFNRTMMQDYRAYKLYPNSDYRPMMEWDQTFEPLDNSQIEALDSLDN